MNTSYSHSHEQHQYEKPVAVVSDLITRYRAVMMNTYGTPALAFTRGHGCWLYDVSGNSYLDMFSGVAVNALGQTPQNIITAVSEQINTLSHVSNYFTAEPIINLAEKLIHAVGQPGKVFFCNSGTEANETAIKLARKTGKKKIIAAQHAFHGRTMGSLALTGQPEKQAAFTPLMPLVTHVPYGDPAAVAASIDSDTAAVIVEPIQGEYGIIVPPAGYLAALRKITAEKNTLLILDEVQTGIGRTGQVFAYQNCPIVPDVVTLAKGLGGGLPLGAMIGIGAAAELFVPGDHGSTFGGNPICAAAALAVLDTVAQKSFLEQVRLQGSYLQAKILELPHTEISIVRGQGLLWGIEFTVPIAYQIVQLGYQQGLLLNATSDKVIRIAPPLIICEHEIDLFINRFDLVVRSALSEQIPNRADTE